MSSVIYPAQHSMDSLFDRLLSSLGLLHQSSALMQILLSISVSFHIVNFGTLLVAIHLTFFSI